MAHINTCRFLLYCEEVFQLHVGLPELVLELGQLLVEVIPAVLGRLQHVLEGFLLLPEVLVLEEVVAGQADRAEDVELKRRNIEKITNLLAFKWAYV